MAKLFVGSYSKLKNFEACPLKYLKVDVQKAFKEQSNEQLVWGNKVHTAMEHALKHFTPLPVDMNPWEKWVKVIHRLPGELLVEQKWALTRSLQPSDYFAPAVWWRTRNDVAKLDGTTKKGVLLDWKTGAMKHDSVQLLLNVVCAFAYFPWLEKVRATFVWLKEDETSGETYTKKDVAEALKNGVLDRIAALEDADRTQNYPPRPSGLCVRHCPVSSCSFWGKGTPR